MTIRSSEYVSLGHPDRVADSIANKVLEQVIITSKNPVTARGGVEAQVAYNKGNTVVTIGGEIKSDTINNGKLDDAIVRDLVKRAFEETGYDYIYSQKFNDKQAPNMSRLIVNNYLNVQSSDIAIATDSIKTGDQGIYWGYAENSNSRKIPLALFVAKELCDKLYNFALKSKEYGIDIKTQVTLDDETRYISDIVVAIPVSSIVEVKRDKLDEDVHSVINSLIEELNKNGSDLHIDENTKYYINNTGLYTVHCNIGDCGTTGRKLVAVTNGGAGKLGGGNMMSKDATKSDVTMNLFARYVAVHLVEAGLKNAEVGLATAIGATEAFGIEVYGTYDDGTPIDEVQVNKIKEILKGLDIWKYSEMVKKIGRFGERKVPVPNTSMAIFGDLDQPWEIIDKDLVNKFKKVL